jgi:hypothetical protein
VTKEQQARELREAIEAKVRQDIKTQRKHVYLREVEAPGLWTAMEMLTYWSDFCRDASADPCKSKAHRERAQHDWLALSKAVAKLSKFYTEKLQ